MKSFRAIAQALFFTGRMMFTVLAQVAAYLIETVFPPLRAASAFGIAGSLSVLGSIGAGGWETVWVIVPPSPPASF